jgi:hypothetical protein
VTDTATNRPTLPVDVERRQANQQPLLDPAHVGWDSPSNLRARFALPGRKCPDAYTPSAFDKPSNHALSPEPFGDKPKATPHC